LSPRERVFRAILGIFLGFVAVNVGLTSQSTEAKVVAWGALMLAIVAFASFASGLGGALARVGLDQDWSLGYLAARLFVGWEFLYAGWVKASTSWYSGAGAGEVKGFLSGGVAQSHATAATPFPNVSHWFAWTANNVFIPHASPISYLVVTAELCIGIGLVLGLFLRLSALFGVLMNALFLLSGSLSAGLNPEMLILGMVLLFGVAPGVYAMSVDGALLPLLRGIRVRTRHSAPAVPAARVAVVAPAPSAGVGADGTAGVT
jgi:thiosulfate dehydrogenase (quinone) large subunit